MMVAMFPEARNGVDAQLSRRLAAVAGRRRSHLAAAVVDVSGDPAVRYAIAHDADPDRLFEIGSITKGLTGMPLADAIDRGEMELRTTVAEILPDTVRSALGEVTARQLCTHTSGLPKLALSPGTLWRGIRYAYIGMDPYRGQTPERVLDQAARQRLHRPERLRYSNLGAAVCGQLVARAHGRDYPALLQRIWHNGATGGYSSFWQNLSQPARLRRQEAITRNHAGPLAPEGTCMQLELAAPRRRDEPSANGPAAGHPIVREVRWWILARDAAPVRGHHQERHHDTDAEDGNGHK